MFDYSNVPVDVEETTDGVLLTAVIIGADKKDIKVSSKAGQNILNIKYKTDDDKKYLYKGIKKSFNHDLYINTDKYDISSIKPKYSKNLLKILIPYKESYKDIEYDIE